MASRVEAAEVELWTSEGRVKRPEPDQTPNAAADRAGARLREISSVAERETAHDRRIRPLSARSVYKDVEGHGQLGCWLRGSHHSKNA